MAAQGPGPAPVQLQPAPPAPPLPPAEPPTPRQIFEVLSRDIKDVILRAQILLTEAARNRNILGTRQEQMNDEVLKIVDALSGIQNDIDNNLGLNSDNTVHIVKNNEKFESKKHGDFGNLQALTGKLDRSGAIQKVPTQGINQFFQNRLYQSTNRGTVLSGPTPEGNKVIRINTLNDSLIGDDNLATDYEDTDLDLTNPEHNSRLQARLVNCQYLEILYITKHEELMKTFAFTLNLYQKYNYSIRLLLYILKNLMDRQCQTPGAPTEGHEGPKPTIKLPKAIISNIRALLNDQKKVQDIITQMESTINENKLPDQITNIAAGPVLTTPPHNLTNLTSPGVAQAGYQEDIQRPRTEISPKIRPTVLELERRRQQQGNQNQ
jgi:hypothetical protein